MNTLPRYSAILLLLLFARPHFTYSQDNRKGTWISPATVQAKIKTVVDVNGFLKTAKGSVRPMICSYADGVLTSSTPFVKENINHQSSNWICHIGLKNDPIAQDYIDLDFTFKLTKGDLKSGGAAVAFDFENWQAENYVLAPAAVYNGNRYRILPVPYPPYIYDQKDKPLDLPITITNVVHLNLDQSPAKIELLTASCSTPMLSFYNKVDKRGWILLTEQGTQLGNSGLMIEEDLSRGRATFVVSAPGVRESRYVMTGFTKGTDLPGNFHTGDEINMRVRLYNFKANSLQEFYGQVFTVRKALSGPSVYRNVAPFSAINDILLDHHDKTKYYEDEKIGYICSEPEGNQPYWHLQAGWAGVPVFSFPQVIQPTPERLRRIGKSFDVLKMMQAKTGLVHGIFMKGVLYGDNFNEKEKNRDIAMVRRSGEMLYFGIQTLELLKRQGNENLIKAEWVDMFKKQADGIIKIWKDYGQFGQFIDVETGKMDINGSTAGAVCISGLALAAKYFNNPEYLLVAESAGHYYYNRDLSNGYLGGGPAEILQCQDSETAYDITEAFTVLYELTEKPEWLNYAQDAAALFSTWTVSYDYKFPVASAMHRIDARATGAVWASIQNAHGAPGMYILSGNFLLKLYRATNDKRYMELLQDIAHNIVQYTTTKTNPVVLKAVPGSVSERVNLCDWEGAENVGGNIPDGDSNMAWGIVTSLTITQNPGIYLRFDTGDLFVLDNVQVKVTGRDKNGVHLKITNPTPYDARVSVLAENSEQAKKILDRYAFMNWPKVGVKSGAAIALIVTSNGKIITQ